MLKTYLCPYCYQYFKEGDLNLICPSPKCEGKFTFKDIPLLKKIRYQINFCPNCKSEQNLITVCPKCSNKIPYEILNGSNSMIALWGSTDSGKTIFLSVLLDELTNNVVQNDTFSIINLGDTAKIMEKNINLIYKDKILPQRTNERGEFSHDGIPLVFLFQDRNKYKDSLLLTFYDAAGEGLQSLESASSLYRYVEHSKAIICILDIGQTDITKKILDNLIQVLRRNKPGKKIETPIAFLYGKSDIIKQDLEKYSNIFEKNDPWPSMQDINAISVEFESFVSNKYASITNSIKNNFKNYKILPVSSLGFNPEDNKNIEGFEIKPLWITYSLKYFILTLLDRKQ